MAEKKQPGFLTTRSTLLRRVKDPADQKSWDEFFRIYSQFIHWTARKTGLTDAEADDVVQETMISATRKLPEFEYDQAKGSFKGWLLQITRRRIADQFRKRPPVEHAPTDADDARRTAFIDRIPDPDSGKLDAVFATEWETYVLKEALKRIQEQIGPKQFQIYKLLVLQKHPAAEVARETGVTVDHVYVIKHRVTPLLKEKVKQLMQEGK